MNFDKLQNPTAERCFLGRSIFNLNDFVTWKPAITPDHFTDPRAKAIYTAQLEIYDKGQQPDLTNLATHLHAKGENITFEYLVDLTATTTLEISYHAKTLLDCHARRVILRKCTEVSKRLADGGEVFQELENLKELEISTLASDEVKSLSQLKLEHAAQISAQEGKYKDVTGIPSGWAGFDLATGGFGEGWLVTIAGRPGMGKTTFALNICNNITNHFNASGLFFSLEMSAQQLAINSIAQENALNAQDVKRGKMSAATSSGLANKYTSEPKNELYINDKAGATLAHIQNTAFMYKRKFDIKFIVIDYLQLVNLPGISDQRLKITEITRKLKELAKALKLPIFMLSQLNRAVDNTPTGRPNLSHLKESSSIEEDSDLVLFLYRPEWYDITETESGKSTEGLTELIKAKFRHGAPGSHWLKLAKESGVFAELDKDGEIIHGYNFGLLQEKQYEAPIDHFDDIEEAPALTGKNPFDGLPF